MNSTSPSALGYVSGIIALLIPQPPISRIAVGLSYQDIAFGVLSINLPLVGYVALLPHLSSLVALCIVSMKLLAIISSILSSASVITIIDESLLILRELHT